jgi:cation transport ATPase
MSRNRGANFEIAYAHGWKIAACPMSSAFLSEHKAGVLAAADTLRSEVPAALKEARSLGIRHIELLTGDNEKSAKKISDELKMDGFLANVLPHEKLDKVKELKDDRNRPPRGSTLSAGRNILSSR